MYASGSSLSNADMIVVVVVVLDFKILLSPQNSVNTSAYAGIQNRLVSMWLEIIFSHSILAIWCTAAF